MSRLQMYFSLRRISLKMFECQYNFADFFLLKQNAKQMFYKLIILLGNNVARQEFIIHIPNDDKFVESTNGVGRYLVYICIYIFC